MVVGRQADGTGANRGAPRFEAPARCVLSRRYGVSRARVSCGNDQPLTSRGLRPTQITIANNQVGLTPPAEVDSTIREGLSRGFKIPIVNFNAETLWHARGRALAWDIARGSAAIPDRPCGYRRYGHTKATRRIHPAGHVQEGGGASNRPRALLQTMIKPGTTPEAADALARSASHT